ncbi:MAG: T9SS type A sorting domain-containing protein, partial [candidate division WOR-3 bacterium]
YAFRGNKSNEFYKYIVADDIWQNAETIRFTYKPNDPLKLNTKRAGKGAALCFDGEQTIYATKGNSTFELWRFNINSNQWIFDTFVPTNKALKGGTAIVYLNGKVYLLAGNQKKYEPNFFAYTPQTKSWQTLQPAPLIPDGKTYKDGSGLAVLQGKIYALKGSAKCNYFYAYDTISNQWTHLQYESIPQTHPMFGKKTKVKDGGSITSDGERIYAIKGGKRNDFWCYQNGTWIPLETIPKSASYPKTGAALTYTNGRIYLLKGNNTKEFWTYIISEISEIGKPNEKTALTLSTLQSEIDNNRHSGLTINPILIKSSATIRYSVTQAGKVALKVYNTSGELIQSILEQEQQIGVYELPFAVQNLSKGVYFIKFVNENFIAQEKIIIQ